MLARSSPVTFQLFLVKRVKMNFCEGAKAAVLRNCPVLGSLARFRMNEAPEIVEGFDCCQMPDIVPCCQSTRFEFTKELSHSSWEAISFVGLKFQANEQIERIWDL